MAMDKLSYYPKDKNEFIGLNRADCSDLVIHILTVIK